MRYRGDDRERHRLHRAKPTPHLPCPDTGLDSRQSRPAVTIKSDHAADAAWVAMNPAAALIIQWERDNSVFNRDTGETHLLSELPATALRALCQRPWAFEALCSHLARLCDTDNDAHWHSKIAGILGGLENLELIERRPAQDGGDHDSA